MGLIEQVKGQEKNNLPFQGFGSQIHKSCCTWNILPSVFNTTMLHTNLAIILSLTLLALPPDMMFESSLAASFFSATFRTLHEVFAIHQWKWWKRDLQKIPTHQLVKRRLDVN